MRRPRAATCRSSTLNGTSWARRSRSGGMGIVYRATDTALGREVAVKVLQMQFGTASRRFAEEARITGQLQHPAIPPVHELGSLTDGRPFLAMKLIRGRTLGALLKERPDPSHDRRRFLAVFEQVCQAVAYAHAQKVIHRDLKPGNVMVGSFGEVQVMDWGLAKVLASRPSGEATECEAYEPASTHEIRSLREADGFVTQAGSVMGTPAYMPPEQALGAIDRIDPRSDVFGLGAILAVILTGKPPFTSNSAETIRIKAAQGKVADCFDRLDSCGAEPELVALCKRCLAPDQADRPVDAGIVAKAVADLRANADERARRAELERAKAETRAVEEGNTRREAEARVEAEQAKATEQRRRWRMQMGLISAFGLLFCASMAFLWWDDRKTTAQQSEKDHRENRNLAAVTSWLDKCESALKARDTAKAKEAHQAAEKLKSEGGADALAGRLEQLRADLKAAASLDALEQSQWLSDAKPKSTLRYAETLSWLDADPDNVGPEVAADRIAGSAIRDRLIGALEFRQWYSDPARATLRLLDPDPFREALRDAGQDAMRSPFERCRTELGRVD